MQMENIIMKKLLKVTILGNIGREIYAKPSLRCSPVKISRNKVIKMKIKIVRTATEKSDCVLIRKAVFVEEQKVPMNLEIDEHEDEAIHFVGYVDDQPVAASRLRFVYGKGKLERICVLKEHRGKSFGKQIIDKMEEVVKDHDIKQTTLN